MKTDRTYADIHLDRIEENMKAVASTVTPGTKIMGIVKADGYGHGAAAVSKTIDAFVSSYGVATADEAVMLRRHGIKKGILVLGPAAKERYRELAELDIRPSISRFEEAQAFSQAALEAKKQAKVHIAVDTGMSRTGFLPGAEAETEIQRIAGLPGIQIEGIFTHFSKADEEDPDFTREQLRRFTEFTDRLKSRGIQIPLRHCSNSAGTLRFREADLNMVRAGIMLYGLHPSKETEKNAALRPAMELKSHITCIREILPGTAVSYGGTYTADSVRRVATVCAGYGDGYPRNLSGKGMILVHGKRAPILGRICMDQFMADVTEIPEAREWELVTLLGREGEEEISMEELAAACGGFHYEIPCQLGKRVPRRYLYHGKPVGALSWLDGEYEGFAPEAGSIGRR